MRPLWGRRAKVRKVASCGEFTLRLMAGIASRSNGITTRRICAKRVRAVMIEVGSFLWPLIFPTNSDRLSSRPRRGHPRWPADLLRYLTSTVRENEGASRCGTSRTVFPRSCGSPSLRRSMSSLIRQCPFTGWVRRRRSPASRSRSSRTKIILWVSLRTGATVSRPFPAILDVVLRGKRTI